MSKSILNGMAAMLDRIVMRLTMGAIGMVMCSSVPVGLVLWLRRDGDFVFNEQSGFESAAEAMRSEVSMFAFALFAGAFCAYRLGFFSDGRRRG